MQYISKESPVSFIVKTLHLALNQVNQWSKLMLHKLVFFCVLLKISLYEEERFTVVESDSDDDSRGCLVLRHMILSVKENPCCDVSNIA